MKELKSGAGQITLILELSELLVRIQADDVVRGQILHPDYTRKAYLTEQLTLSLGDHRSGLLIFVNLKITLVCSEFSVSYADGKLKC